jgi:hypothetical protein
MLRIRIAAAKLVNCAGKNSRADFYCLTSAIMAHDAIRMALDAERPESFQHKCVKSPRE